MRGEFIKSWESWKTRKHKKSECKLKGVQNENVGRLQSEGVVQLRGMLKERYGRRQKSDPKKHSSRQTVCRGEEHWES